MSKQSDLVNITQGDTITVDHDDNRVGIGTTSPNSVLEVKGSSSGQNILHLSNSAGTSDGSAENQIRVTCNGNTNWGNLDIQAYSTIFTQNGTERMRIDSSGNLLVSKSSSSFSTVGSEFGAALNSEGWVSFLTSNNTTANVGGTIALNRKSTDGDIARFFKDGSTVGSIGANGGKLYISNEAGTGGLRFYNGGINPCDGDGNESDNQRDLGKSSSRWDDIYATNSTIQTSDRNEKQDIETLSDAEQRVAQACKGLLRKFRWIDAVEEKGDNARIHFGIIAQDLQAAFAAEGLDAGDYAMFISSTWWETQTEVPAVEAVEEVVDEDGNVITEAVEAQEAYTRTDTYETAEEAPEGATERTRLGVRYPELLAFIIGAM